MEMLILVVLIGIVLARLYDAHHGEPGTKNDAVPSVNAAHDDLPFHSSSGIYNHDIFTDPAYSHIPGNIYYQALINLADGTSDDDLCTNPAYSLLACDIYHGDDDWQMGSMSHCSSSLLRTDD